MVRKIWYNKAEGCIRSISSLIITWPFRRQVFNTDFIDYEGWLDLRIQRRTISTTFAIYVFSDDGKKKDTLLCFPQTI